MKKQSFIILLLVSGTCCQAQAVNEWLQQKQAQRKHQVEQIAAFRTYLSYAQQGYAIAEWGLRAIGKSKQGAITLHKGFFDHLKRVNPALNSYSKVAGVVALQLKIIQVSKEVRRSAKEKALFDRLDLEYINRVFEEMLADCSTILANLSVVVSANALQMKDDERLKRIEALYQEMQERYVFTQGFGSAIKVLGLQRERAKKDVAASRTLYDIEMD